MLWIAGLIERVVPSNPGILPVPGSNLFPKPHRAVLVILVIPERGVASRIVRMPVRILAAGNGVHVQDGIDAMGRTLIQSDQHMFMA